MDGGFSPTEQVSAASRGNNNGKLLPTEDNDGSAIVSHSSPSLLLLPSSYGAGARAGENNVTELRCEFFS